jgi:hypothetical protein
MLAALLAAILALVAAQSAAGALGGAAPWRGSYAAYPPHPFELYKGKQLLQETRTAEGYNWYFFDPETETWQHTRFGNPHKKWTYPATDTVKASRIVYLRVLKPEPPDRITIKSYNRWNLSDKPFYLKPGWVPVRNAKGKIIGHDILFKLEKPHSQHYLHIYTGWQKREGTLKSYGWTKQGAHLKTY